MKQIFLPLFIAAMASCTPSTKKPRSDGGSQQQTVRVDPSKLIVPGKSIGKLYLNQDMDSVFQIMGKADAGDAAMGKAWSIWLSQASGTQLKEQIAIFSSYKDSSYSGSFSNSKRNENGDASGQHQTATPITESRCAVRE